MVERLHRLAALLLILGAARGGAYPRSVVFAPSGEVQAFATVELFTFASLFYRPALTPGVTWIGLNAGLLPEVRYWKDGPSFGGLEVSVDAVMPWAYPGQAAYVKPMLSAKMQLITEGLPYLPAVSVGVLGVTPGNFRHGMSLVYASFTKTITIKGVDFGQVTVGGGSTLNSDPSIFNGTFPFFDTQVMWLAGYESPNFGPFSFGIDALSGSSEVSGLNAIVSIDVVEGASVGVGGFFALERRLPSATYDGLMVYFSGNMNLAGWAKKYFGKKDAASAHGGSHRPVVPATPPAIAPQRARKPAAPFEPPAPPPPPPVPPDIEVLDDGKQPLQPQPQ